jgi:hypothetical protein
MHDDFINDVNTLCNDSVPLSDRAIELVENLHGNEVHGAVSVMINSTAKSKAGNSSMNFNQQLLNMDRVSNSVHVSLMIHVDPGSESESVVQQRAEAIDQWSTPVKRSKRREGSVDEDSSVRAQCLKALRTLMLWYV